MLPESREFASDFIREFERHKDEGVDHFSSSVIQYMEDMARSTSANFMRAFHEVPNNRTDTPYERDMAMAAVASIYTLGETRFALENAVESRLLHSDYLLMFYLVTSDTLHTALQEKAQMEGREVFSYSLQEQIDIKALYASEVIERHRSKNKEILLSEKFPDAPTTGFEYELDDPLRFLYVTGPVTENRIKILGVLEDDPDLDTAIEICKAQNLFETTDAFDFFLEVISLAQEERQKRLSDEKRHLSLVSSTIESLPLDYDGIKDVSEDYTRDLIRTMMIDRIRGVLVKNADTLTSAEKLKYQNMLDFLSSGTFSANVTPSRTELSILLKSVPTKTELMGTSGAFTTIPELTGAEVITSPSVSLRVQLRDFLHVALSGGLEGELSVHQTVGGVELSPEYHDIMEVRAMLDAAGLLREQKDDYSLELDISTGSPVSELIMAGRYNPKESYMKTSICSDGLTYYFAFHRYKQPSHEGNIAYPEKSRSLVEFRTLPLLDKDTSFISHVKATTFRWLASWGEQASQKPEDARNDSERQCHEKWQETLNSWYRLLQERGVERPQPHEYYDQIYSSAGGTVRKEKYTSYLEKIKLVRSREHRAFLNGEMFEEETFDYQAEKIIREYRDATKKIIGY